MQDEIKLADEKLQIQRRIQKGIFGLRGHLVNRADINVLDRITLLVNPGLAYRDHRGIRPYGPDELSSFISNLHRARAQVPKKLSVVFHEIAVLLFHYWELIRSDQTSGLDSRLIQLEGWAKYGLKECELLGGPGVGYSLFNRAVQKEGE